MGSQNDRKIRVLVVDDHELFAEALVLALARDERIEPVGHASEGLEGVAMAEQLDPDVVLMDLHMPGFDGVDATRMLSDLCPDARVIVVTASTSPHDAERALGAGAAGVLLKQASAAALIDAVVKTGAALTEAA